GMVPSSSSNSTRTAFARSGPGAFRSPTSSLVCSPPTPRCHGPRLRSPLPSVYLETRALLLRASCRAHADAQRFGVGSLAPRNAGFFLFEEKRGSPRLLGHPCHTRCEPNTTPDVRRSGHDDRRPVAFGAYGTLGIRNKIYFRGHHAAT